MSYDFLKLQVLHALHGEKSSLFLKRRVRDINHEGHEGHEGKRRGIRILFFLNFMSFMLFMVKKFFVLKEKDEEILTMKDMKSMKVREEGIFIFLKLHVLHALHGEKSSLFLKRRGRGLLF